MNKFDKVYTGNLFNFMEDDESNALQDAISDIAINATNRISLTDLNTKYNPKLKLTRMSFPTQYVNLADWFKNNR